MSEQTSEVTIDEETKEQESSVIRQLRAQNDTLKQQLKERDDRLAEGAKASREATEQLLIAAGFPKLTDVVIEKVEGFPTEQSVNEVLKGLGLVQAETSTESDADSEQPDKVEAIAGVANLGQKVASAAGGAGRSGVSEKLAKAKTPAEVAAVMAEAGLLHTQ